MISRRIEKRLSHEIGVALAAHDCRGASKHAAKQAAHKMAQDNHTKYAPVTGLYSSTSYSTYSKQAMTALRRIADKHNCHNVAECRTYAREYYDTMCAQGLSAWTIHTRVYALCSVYHTDYRELLGVSTLPRRSRRDCFRGRVESASDTRYHTQEQDDARTLARAIGARRGGLLALAPQDLVHRADGLFVHLSEKGGKERDAFVLPSYADAVRDIFARYTALGIVVHGKQRLLPHTALPKNMALHRFRAQYAQDLCGYFAAQGDVATGEMYYCRADRKGEKYDKGILLAVSKNLGHSRCDVVVCHYLYH